MGLRVFRFRVSGCRVSGFRVSGFRASGVKDVRTEALSRVCFRIKALTVDQGYSFQV